METIDVVCVITPDGRLAYAWDADSVRLVLDNWRADLTDEQRRAHADGKTYGGAVQIRMLRSEWNVMNITVLSSGGSGGA